MSRILLDILFPAFIPRLERHLLTRNGLLVDEIANLTAHQHRTPRPGALCSLNLEHRAV